MIPRRTILQRLLPTLCLSLTASLSFCQYNLTDKIPLDPDIRSGRLPNGLTYYIRNNSNMHNVQLRLVVNAGSVQEDEDQQGLAHFMEHMNFNGLKHFPKNELVAYLQSLGLKVGADLNAYTGFDATNYVLWLTSGDSKKIDKGFTILEDWSHNALLDPQEIDKERNIVLEESRLHKTAADRMRQIYMPTLVNGSKYAERIPIGKDSIIAHFKPESLRRFYDTWYRPDLEAVVVVGDIDPDYAEKEIVKHFSNYSNPTQEQPRPSIIPILPRKENKGLVVIDKEFQSTLFEIYDRIERQPSVTTWEDYRQQVVEQLFNSMIDERLRGITQQANPPFLSGDASFRQLYRGYRTFSSFINVGDKPLQPAIDSLVVTLGSIKKYGFLDAELQRAKNKYLHKASSDYADIGKAETSSFVEEYVDHYLDGTPIIAPSDRYHFIEQVVPGITMEEVDALAKKIDADQGNFALLLSSGKETLPSGSGLEGFLASAQQLPVMAYGEHTVGNSLMDHLPAGGSITGEKRDRQLGSTELELSNGVTITLKPTDFKNDDIRMDAWRWGGFHNYPINDKPNAMNAARIVQAMGIDGFPRTELDKFLAGKTVHVQPYINAYEEGVEGECGAGDVETFLQLIYLYLTRPARDETLFNSFVGKEKSLFQNLKANPMNYYADTLVRIEYNNNPWANSIPLASDYDHISLDRILSIYKEIFSNAYGQHFTFVGSFDPETIKPLLARYLGSLPSTAKENKYTDEGMRPAKGAINATIAKGTARQALVTLHFDGEGPYTREDVLKLDFLVEILNVRIFQQLREEMGGTYNASMYASFNKRPYEHYTVTAQVPCAPENVEKMNKALFDIINDTRENGVGKDYMAKVREMIMNHHAGQLKANEYWLQTLSSCWIDQEDPAWLTDFYKMMLNISAKDLRLAAVKYLDPANYIKVVLRPE